VTVVMKAGTAAGADGEWPVPAGGAGGKMAGNWLGSRPRKRGEQWAGK